MFNFFGLGLSTPEACQKALQNNSSRQQLIHDYPDKPWPWYQLHTIFVDSCDLFNILTKHPNKSWNWPAIFIKIDTYYLSKLLLRFPQHAHFIKDWTIVPTCWNLWELINTFPNQPWDWTMIHQRICTENLFDLIKKFPDKPWNLKAIFEDVNHIKTIKMNTKLLELVMHLTQEHDLPLELTFGLFSVDETFKMITQHFHKIRDWHKIIYWLNVLRWEYEDNEYSCEDVNDGKKLNETFIELVNTMHEQPWPWDQFHRVLPDEYLVVLMSQYLDKSWNWPEITKEISILYLAMHADWPWNDKELVERCGEINWMRFANKVDACQTKVVQQKVFDEFDKLIHERKKCD